MNEFNPIPYLPTVEMVEFQRLVTAMVMRSLNMPRWIANPGTCRAHATAEYFSARLGDRGVVLVDGLKRNHVTQCKTGANGWAEQIVHHNNRPVLDPKTGDLKRRILTGVVVFRKKP